MEREYKNKEVETQADNHAQRARLYPNLTHMSEMKEKREQEQRIEEDCATTAVALSTIVHLMYSY